MNKLAQAYDLSEAPHQPKFALTQFTAEEFFSFWPQLEEMLDYIPHTWRHWTKEYIQNAVGTRVIQMWGIGPPPNAVFVFFTQVNVFPSMRVLSLTWGAGSFDVGMIPLVHATMVNFAKLHTCEEIEVRGRDGWGPMLKPLGFKKDHSTWTLRVPDMRLN